EGEVGLVKTRHALSHCNNRWHYIKTNTVLPPPVPPGGITAGPHRISLPFAPRIGNIILAISSMVQYGCHMPACWPTCCGTKSPTTPKTLNWVHSWSCPIISMGYCY